MNDPLPRWLEELEGDDLQFIYRFVLASGSLKELAQIYSVSYPTVRGRLDRLIAKVRAAEAPEPADPLERKVRIWVADGKLSANMAKELLTLYQSSKQQTPRDKSSKGDK